MSPILLVVTSAGVATLVTGLLGAFTQWLERRSRRRELLLTKAIDLARMRVELVREVAKNSGREVVIHDYVKMAEVYYQWLLHLLEEDELPPDASPLENVKRKKTPLPPPTGEIDLTTEK